MACMRIDRCRNALETARNADVKNQIPPDHTSKRNNAPRLFCIDQTVLLASIKPAAYSQAIAFVTELKEK